MYRRSRCPCADFLHKATTDRAQSKSVIAVTDLSVRGMLRNRPLARSVADAPVAFRRTSAYSPERYGSRLVVAPGFYPSTQTCSACGQTRAERSLGERLCPGEGCGAEIARGRDAARNLAALVGGSSPETQNAPGAAGSGQGNGRV